MLLDRTVNDIVDDPRAAARSRSRDGTIPAHAGEPGIDSGACRASWDYPRARGGTMDGPLHPFVATGLSPRTRGNRWAISAAAAPSGTIPAHAGEPRPSAGRTCPPRDYPRARGGTIGIINNDGYYEGLSPRTRGNHGAAIGHSDVDGTIPAHAGEPRRRSPGCSPGRDYPRARGGTEPSRSVKTFQPGLSPRTRGNPAGWKKPGARTGTIPAHAGEPPASPRCSESSGDYPRARGGTPTRKREAWSPTGLSPRARGNPGIDQEDDSRLGTIPAHAGEPQDGVARLCSVRDYPRARGGTQPTGTAGVNDVGLSPRTRGNRPHHPRNRRSPGTIPAHAGEPLSGPP